MHAVILGLLVCFQMARTSFFRIPEGISHPVVLIEGSSARIIEFDEACELTDDSNGRIPEARWSKAKDIRSNRGKITVKTCELTNDRSARRGLSLTLSPATPLGKRGGDFRRSHYHQLLDDLASGRPWADQFLRNLQTTGDTQNR